MDDAQSRVEPTRQALKDGKEDEDIIKLRELREEFKCDLRDAKLEKAKLKLAGEWPEKQP